MSCMPSTTETTQNKGRRTYRNDDVCIQPNFMNHTYQTTNQTSTTQTTKTTTSTWVSPLTQNLCSYNWDNANSGVFIFKFQPISKNSYSINFLHFMHHQFVHFIDLEKPVHGLRGSYQKTRQLLLFPKYSKTQVSSLLNISMLFLFLSS